MNKKTIIELINDPTLLSSEVYLDEIKNLSQKFPYSSTIQLLLTKALHTAKDLSFNEQLKIAAIVCPDRKKLYQIIHQTQLRSLITEIEEEVSDHEEIIVTTNDKTTEESSLHINHLKENQNRKNEELDVLEQNILIEAINSSIHLEIPETIEDDFSGTLENEELTDIEPAIEQQRNKFTNWFSSNTQEKEKVNSSGNVSSLIDSFLKQEKKNIKKPEFFSPGNLGKISLVDNEEFVTETLASVYAAQGNLEKAIRIYERLILKNPEKSTFFASRIRFLKDKLENKKE